MVGILSQLRKSDKLQTWKFTTNPTNSFLTDFSRADGNATKVAMKETFTSSFLTDFSRVHENATEVAMKEIFEEVLFVEFVAD